MLRALSFGYNELWADALWIRTIAYFTDHVTGDRDLRHIHRYLKNVIALDDHFKAVYRYGAAMMMSKGARQTNDDVLAAIDLLKRGHAAFPDDDRFPFTIGAYYLTELRTRARAERARWRQMGADWLRRAVLLGADIPWLPSLAAKVYTEQGEREMAIAHLQEMYLVTQDEETRKQIAAKLRSLEARSLADRLRQEGERLAKEYSASAFSFVPLDLYALIRLSPVGPFALEAAPPPG